MSNTTIYGNISNQFPDNTLATGTTDISGSIYNLNNSLSAINDKTNTLLTQQVEVSNIVNQEQGRLSDKKKSVDNAYSSQVRSIYMNDNINKRYNAYLKILYALVIVLIIVFILSIIGNYFPFIPSFVLNIIYIGLFSFTMIYSNTIYSEIKTHDRIDYDKLKLRRAADGGLDISGNDSSGNDLSGNVTGLCAEINPINGKCVRLLDGFSSMNELSSLNTYEFTDYSRY